jgi:hypothetical protein
VNSQGEPIAFDNIASSTGGPVETKVVSVFHQIHCLVSKGQKKLDMLGF